MRRVALMAGAVISLIVVVAAAGQHLRSETRSNSETKSKAEASDKTQWEYLIVAGGNANLSTSGNDQYRSMRKQPDGAFSREWFPLERNFDKLGAQGWELVTVIGPPTDPIFYFKRPKETAH